MTYREAQRNRILTLLDEMFNDSGGGKFANGVNYPFILQNPVLNLWEVIRDDALAYFKNNNIPWWMSTPSSHCRRGVNPLSR